MKAFALLTLLIIMSSLASAAPAYGNVKCAKNAFAQTLPTSGNSQVASMSDMRSTASSSILTGYRLLGNTICALYERSDDLGAHIPLAIYKFVSHKDRGENRIFDPENNLDLVLKELSKNKNDLKCANGDDIIARAFDRGLHYVVMEDIFLGEMLGDSSNFDFNAVTWTYNPKTGKSEPMTVLDFIQKIAFNDRRMSGTPGSKRYMYLQSFTNDLINEYGARNFIQLDTATRKQFLGLKTSDCQH